MPHQISAPQLARQALIFCDLSSLVTGRGALSSTGLPELPFHWFPPLSWPPALLHIEANNYCWIDFQIPMLVSLPSLPTPFFPHCYEDGRGEWGLTVVTNSKTRKDGEVCISFLTQEKCLCVLWSDPYCSLLLRLFTFKSWLEQSCQNNISRNESKTMWYKPAGFWVTLWIWGCAYNI